MLLVYENRDKGISVEWKRAVHMPPHLHEAIRLYMNPLYKLFRLSGKLDRLKNHILPSRGMFFL